MRNWCKNHPILFMGYYLVFYLIFFALLENAIKVPHLTLHCALDDMIPFFLNMPSSPIICGLRGSPAH